MINMGIILENQQKFKEAILQFKAALKINPDNVKAIEGMRRCEKALDPNDPSIG